MPSANTGSASRKNVLRWSVSNITMTSGRVSASCSFWARNSVAISQSGPSRLTNIGNTGVCGTPKPPTICAMFSRSCCANISANEVENAMARKSRPKKPKTAPKKIIAGGAARDPARARPLRLFADRRPPGAALAERRPRRALGHPQHRAFPVRPARHQNLRRRDGRESGHPQLRLARLRRPRRHLAADGDHAEVRRPRHRGAELRCLPRISADHRGRQQASLGVDGPRRHQLDHPQRPDRGRGARADQGERLRHRQKHRQGAARLAQPRHDRDGAHARHPGRERHRIHRQLGQRRAALSDEGAQGLDDLDAVFVGDSTTFRRCCRCTRARSGSAR